MLPKKANTLPNANLSATNVSVLLQHAKAVPLQQFCVNSALFFILKGWYHVT